jgi:hypothetical protein
VIQSVRLAGAAGIKLKVVLNLHKLLIPLVAKPVTNSKFGTVEYMLGTRIGLRTPPRGGPDEREKPSSNELAVTRLDPNVTYRSRSLGAAQRYGRLRFPSRFGGDVWRYTAARLRTRGERNNFSLFESHVQYASIRAIAA